MFVAMAQRDDISILNSTFKGLIGSIVFPNGEIAINEHQCYSNCWKKTDMGINSEN